MIKKTVNLQGKQIDYLLRVSLRARYLRLSVTMEYGLVVTKPQRIPEFFVERFLQSKTAWIFKYLEKVSQANKLAPIKITFHEFETNKAKALKLFRESVAFFNSFYKFPYGKVTVRNQSSLWGSCSREGNLQFNFKLTKLPRRMLDYVVVHELCHVREHNHSVRFWALVAQTIPDYKPIRRELRNFVM